MPTLNWIGKEAVVNHHHQVPFHLLKDVPDLACGQPGDGNLIVQGDNLLGLKALLPYYAGQVKCIYIDPPYNTGNEGWIYNDNVNSPVIREWLGKVVGKEGETLDRHDRWLCMMYPRLTLLRQLLRDDGVLFASIGRDEIGNLRFVCDEIFGSHNLIEILIWNTHGHTENQEEITGVHEYILLYAKNKGRVAIRNVVDPSIPADSKIRRDFAENSITKNGPKNPPSVIDLPIGFPCEVETLDLPTFERFDEFRKVALAENAISRELTRQYEAVYPLRGDAMKVRGGRLSSPCRVFTGWSSADKLKAFIANRCEPIDDGGTSIRFYLSKNGVIYYRREGRASHYVQSVLTNLGTTELNRYLLEQMGLRFDYPKPVELIGYLVSLYTEPGEMILDSFAGSGTSGHSVLGLGQHRKFIQVEMEPNIARNVVAPRLTKVAEGYTTVSGDTVRGLGGSFRYCELGESLFDEKGKIRETVSFGDLARHVYFTETGEPLPGGRVAKLPFLGACRGVGIYLLYNGILGDKSTNGGNILTRAVLAKLPFFEGQKVIYCAGCLLGRDRLQVERILVRQTPYEVRVS
jgi:adenine-specific DNA-methyltransferase